MHASTLFIFTAVLVSEVTLNHASKWSYKGTTGPKYWHELFPHACSGRYQSPIDLKPEQTMYDPKLKDLAIWYDPPKPGSKFYIKNNGHTIQVDLKGDFFFTNAGLGSVYKAIQFHYHWGHKAHHGSEHVVDGKPSPIEMHVVTYNQDFYTDIQEAVTQKGGLAVMGVLYEISPEDNPLLDVIIKAFKYIRDPETQTRVDIPIPSLRDLLPDDISRYYRYNGSLTTPGCFESVIWTVFDKKQTISKRQLEEFRSMLQFKHKRRKNHRRERHRRSMTDEEKAMEHKAQDVLREIGIEGDHFEEAVFKAKLVENHHGLMMGDMPEESRESGHKANSHSKPTLDEEGAAKIDKHMDEHLGHNTKDGNHVPANSNHSQGEEEVIEYEVVQHRIVNNFRPVQPLNNRMVYRNFKLRDPITSRDSDHSARSQPIKRDDDDENGSERHSATVVVLSMCAFVYVSLSRIMSV